MKKLAVLYGLFEGPLIGDAFTDECKRRGFLIVDDPADADVIVAHSGGWLFLPTDTTGKQVVLVNVSHDSHVSILRRFAGRMQYDIRHVVLSRLFPTWLYQRVLNCWYLLIKFPVWLEMGRRYKVRDITPLIALKNVIVLQSADMSWYDHETMVQAHKIIMLDSGCHDDCWLRPQVYLDSIDQKV